MPVGNAHNAGLVRSTPPRHAPRGDRDADGVPDALDVDVNGNRIFNDVDRATARRGARGAQAQQTFDYGLYLSTRIEDTVNADAGSTPAQIAAALPAHGGVHLGIATGDAVELDCGGVPDLSSPTGWSGGLAWCAKGGTGTAGGQNRPEEARFPGCCDPDGDGYGTMTNNTGSPQAGPHMSLSTHATADQIGTGDTLVERVTTGGVEHQLVTTLQYSVATVPAIVAYDDGQGDAVTVAYPVAGGGLTPGLGTEQNPFPVKADRRTGRVAVNLTFWRPQRSPVPPDAAGAGGDPCLSGSSPCQWIDIGGLDYMVGVEHAGGLCPQSAFLSKDAPLTGGTDLPGTPGVKDTAADQPASPRNVLAVGLDLTACAASPVRGDGSPLAAYAFAPGDTRSFGLQYRSASPLGSNVDGGQELYFRRVS